MRKRRAALLLAAAAGVVALVRSRSRSSARARADVWFDDGSSVSLPGSSPPGSRLVELAEAALRAAE